MLKTAVILVASVIRLLTFTVGAYLEFYGLKLLIAGEADTIPFVSITPQGIEGRELPIAAFVCIVGLVLIALAVSMRGRVRDTQGDVNQF